LLVARYKLTLPLADIPGAHDDALLEEIGRRRGAVMAGGRVNLQKAAEIVINDFRSAILGRITLETPPEFEAWVAEALVREEKLQAERAARNQKRKSDRSPRILDAAPADDSDDLED